MARLLQALGEYGPKLELAPTVGTEAVVEHVMDNNPSLRRSIVRAVLMEIAEAILFFNNQGIPVKLEGVGTFTPTIDRHGTIRHNYRADVQLKKRSNDEGAYTGKIANQEHIGLDNAGFKALWDVDHPDDPLAI